MIPVALACGNTFVLKPSDKGAPPNRRGEPLAESGLPEGVFHIVPLLQGLRRTPALASLGPRSPFVGSTSVPRHVYETVTRNGKRVQVGLAGRQNHLSVMPAPTSTRRAKPSQGSAFGCAGDVHAVSLALPVAGIADRWVEGCRPGRAR